MNELPDQVYLVDDDKAVSRAIELLLRAVGFGVVKFSDPLDFLSQLPRLLPGCLVIDIRMPHLSGLKVQERLADSGCDWPVIVISGHGDIQACRRAFKNGAVDFLSKPVDEQDLIDAIQRGLRLLGHNQAQAAQRAEAAGLLAKLSAREHDVLDFVCRGFTAREIADKFGLSPRTVESHRARIAEKLGTSSAVELAKIYADGSSQP